MLMRFTRAAVPMTECLPSSAGYVNIFRLIYTNLRTGRHASPAEERGGSRARAGWSKELFVDGYLGPLLDGHRL